MNDDVVTLRSAEREVWHLRSAILVYASESNGIAPSQQSRMYATLHQVRGRGRTLQLEAGVPATREACADIARALGANAKLGGFVPPSLLYLGAKSLIWWRAPGPARLFFDCTKAAAGDQSQDKAGAALIGRRNGIVPHPGLVFAIAGGKWFVYAVKGDARPDPAAALWRAPYFNVWNSGQICTGNVRLPETLSAQSLAVYERAFFDSEFTHPNIRGAERLVAGGAYTFWRELLDAGPKLKSFPAEKKLIDQKLTLQGLAKRLEKGASDDD
jgi:PRTRC genetic system protein B